MYVYKINLFKLFKGAIYDILNINIAATIGYVEI